MIGTEFVPAEDRGQFEVIAELPPGTSFEQSEVMVGTLEQKLLSFPRSGRSSRPSASTAIR